MAKIEVLKSKPLLALTVIAESKVFVQPDGPFFAVSLTLCCPNEKLWPGFWSVEVVPSPKSQSHEVAPTELSLKSIYVGVQTSGVNEKKAMGGFTFT